MSEKLFATSDLNPMSADHRQETVIADQGGAAELYIQKPGEKLNPYLTGALYFPPETPTTERKVYTEEKSVRIKREYPIEVFASMHLPAGRTHGRVAMYVCPWHDDKGNPNLEVYQPGHKKYGTCKCWRCGQGGSVVDLAMAVFGVSSPGEAMNLIEGKSGFDEQKRQQFAERSRKLAEQEANRPRLNPQEHIEDMVAWAADNLRSDPVAVRYLASRGLGSAMSPFLLGSSWGMPDELLPQAWDGERGKVYGARSFRETPLEDGSRKVGRIVIPYLRPDGTVHYVNARAAGKVHKRDKYRKPSDVMPEPYLLDVATMISERDIIMTEGEMDALSMLVTLKDAPIGVFAVPGLNCFTEADAAKLAGRRVFIVTDNDEAGNDGRENLTDMVYGYADHVFHLSVEQGFNDINEMLVARGRQFLRGWLRACVEKADRHVKKRFF